MKAAEQIEKQRLRHLSALALERARIDTLEKRTLAASSPEEEKRATYQRAKL